MLGKRMPWQPSPLMRSRFRQIVLLSALVIPMSGCAIHEYTKDVSPSAQSAAVFSHAFCLRRDGYVVASPEEIQLADSGHYTVQVYGWVYVPQKEGDSPTHPTNLPKGTRVVVERVLSTYYPMVGTILKPYVRLGREYNGLYLDASWLFEQAWDGGPPLRPLSAYLEPCD
jgi:hypothetical protein